MKARTLTVSITDELLKKVEDMAKAKMIPKASIVKIALAEYFEKIEKSENK